VSNPMSRIAGLTILVGFMAALPFDPRGPLLAQGASLASQSTARGWDERRIDLPIVGPSMAYVPHVPTTRVVLLISGDGGLSWQVLGKPTDASNPRMTMTILFGPDPIFIVGTQGAGAWRYAAH